ncbi:hypothetical protein [Candidatus Magnetominusculus xianensis]|uniref:Uncharacterized protein n=1 Tax=Candidatus Magnetominusculus xianensis TaxID=1748249 RepID=A0ABR5SGS7_9BACT|nr:hypothetical protein [Candidatus Magnetominusculus xianensis]KWT84958.1 hypothetical protein ASN18_1888 [Candidatus Magnetominusculus xianensis]MBF0404461.1 hypothetical protein [Nitrospirota bacterium]
MRTTIQSKLAFMDIFIFILISMYLILVGLFLLVTGKLHIKEQIYKQFMRMKGKNADRYF